MKKLSLISLVSTVLFIVGTFSMSNANSVSVQNETFGFPFVFFTAPNGEKFASFENFSAMALVADLALCIAASLVLVYLGSLLKIQKKTNKTTAVA